MYCTVLEVTRKWVKLLENDEQFANFRQKLSVAESFNDEQDELYHKDILMVTTKIMNP